MKLIFVFGILPNIFLLFYCDIFINLCLIVGIKVQNLGIQVQKCRCSNAFQKITKIILKQIFTR